MDRERLMILRSALDRADLVADRLLVALRDHLDRTARLLGSTIAIVVAVSAGLGLLLRSGFELPWLAAFLVAGGWIAEVVAMVLFAVAYASLPGDEGVTFGTDPSALVRRALHPGTGEVVWLEAELRAVAGQLLTNGYVIAVLVRRRHWGVLWMTLGLTGFLGSITYIVMSNMLGR